MLETLARPWETSMTATLHTRWPLTTLLVLGLLPGWTAPARATDIATAPLFTSSTTVVKPNVMFVLDDSGSMAWDYLPDNANFRVRTDSNGRDAQYGRLTSQCNGVAYNPDDKKVAYDLPVDATGTPKAAGDLSFLSSGNRSNLSNARSVTPTAVAVVSTGTVTVTVGSSGWQASWYPVGSAVTLYSSGSNSQFIIGKVKSWNSGTGALAIDVAMAIGSGTLSNATVGNGVPNNSLYYSYSGSQKAMDYRYPGNSLDTSTTFYKECASVVGVAPGASVFTAQIVTPSSADAQRYANWYQYYRTRMDMMKTSVTLAFKTLDSKYRIGFSTILNTGVTEGTDFLHVRDFGDTQKVDFYSKLDSATPGGSTPLRGALAKAGRYYAKKISGQTYDPVQYSCQKNFTILSTDGYWNTDDETSSYGPLQLNGSTQVGQQDGAGTDRPMFDGNSSTSTTTERWTVTTTYQRTTQTPYSQVTAKSTTTTYTPASGQTYKSYSMDPLTQSWNNSSLSPSCSSRAPYTCTITVKTSSNHGLSGGESITISGVSPAVYNGSFTITRKDNNEFYYTLSGLSSVPSTPGSGNRGSSTYAPSSCPAGQGMQYEQVWTRDLRNISIQTDTTTAYWTRTKVENITDTTPYTRTIVSVNGVQSSDTTTAGTTTSSASPVSQTDGAKTSQNTSSTSSGGSDYTAWAGSTPAAIGCASTLKSTTAVSTIAATTSVVTNGPVAGSPGSETKLTPETQTFGPKTESIGAKTTSTSSTSTGGSTNALADVAMYYYKTDLRTSDLGNCTGALGTSVCDNNVTAVGRDNATWQHMSTYTLSLGNSGTMQYDPNYESQSSGDFKNVLTGAADWPVPGDNAGAVNIDDLWHAAVNGRGRYFSATDPSTLASSLASALNSIQAVTGSSSAAATSTLQPVEGDNGVFIAQFRSAEWTGDLRAYTMNTSTGAVRTSTLDAQGNRVDTATWSASDQLTPTTTRSIYYFQSSGSGNGGSLQPFVYDSMSAAEKALFDNACNKSPALSQCSGLATTPLAQVNSGANLVSFLRGQAQTQYRTRAKVLGDIVNSSPVYVGPPSMPYTEHGYATFKTQQASRGKTLYVGANDGMLHAINAANGSERWAYIPKLVMPNLYKLADQYYESKHQYYVDATPVVADIYTGTQWRTILVGGLNAGGSGYYALDITDPDAPVALWEFSHAKLGLSFGNPVITKRANGTWVVAFTSGYNNSDGLGYLFVLNAYTGAMEISQPIGTGAPEGLSKLNAWVDTPSDNTAKRFYAGDLQGNIWRFTIDDADAPNGRVVKLAQLLQGGKPQPITTAPQLAEIEANGGRYAVVYVGTGRYLGKTDISTSDQQSIYAVKDTLASEGLGDVRGGGTLVKQTVDTSVTPRKVGSASTPVDWSTKNGWYVDLVSTSERINVEMELAFDTLTAAANIPGTSGSDCTAAANGTAWLYQINVTTGQGSSSAVSSMVAGLSTVQIGKQGLTIVTKTDATDPDSKASDSSMAIKGPPRRSAWRELIE